MDSERRVIMKNLYYIFSMLLFVLVWNPQLNAENRALIIGVGDYESDLITDLPGINKDLILMRNAFVALGVQESMIRILEDYDSTQANVENEIRHWISNGLSRNDRVYIYFTGHGSQIPDTSNDEGDDGMDELLLLHDSEVVDRNLVNILLDDSMETLLSSIPASNVFVFMDACHTGSAHRAFGTQVAKFTDFGIPDLVYESKGAPGGSRGRFQITAPSSGSSSASGNKFVLLSACQDDEQAVATSQGSIFTLGLAASIVEAANGNKEITMRDLLDSTTEYVYENVDDRDQIFKPNLSGESSLSRVNLFIDSDNNTVTNETYSEYWKTLVRSVQEANFAVPVVTNQSSFYPGDSLEIYVDVPRDGYLYVFNISQEDSEEDMLILYPNSYDKNNRVRKDTMITIPPNNSFTLPASPPYAESLIVVFLLPKSLPLEMDSQKMIAGIFPLLKDGEFIEQLNAQKPSRGKFAVVPGEPLEEKVIGAGKAIVEVIPRPE